MFRNSSVSILTWPCGVSSSAYAKLYSQRTRYTASLELGQHAYFGLCSCRATQRSIHTWSIPPKFTTGFQIAGRVATRIYTIILWLLHNLSVPLIIHPIKNGRNPGYWSWFDTPLLKFRLLEVYFQSHNSR